MAAAVGTPDDVKNVANYVLSLSNSPHDSLRAQLGKAKFTACAACHGMDGKGNQALGAPNLTDDVWLHGWGEQAIVNMVNNGKVNEMPAQQGKLTEAQIHVLATYVWGLSNRATARQALKEFLPVTSPAAVRKVIPIVPAGPEEPGESLYEAQKKIYPRKVTGLFARWRWGFVFLTQIIFYGLPWLEWGERQAVLFDLGARRFYIFGHVLYPQDFIYLTGLLVISALSLFLFTAVAGRLWCGFSCPQTVYTEIFLWIERKIEGDRNARMRLDASPMSAGKFARKGAKHAVWITLALVDRLHLRGLLHADQDAVGPGLHAVVRPLGVVLGEFLRAGHLRQRRLHARAGLQVHVPVRALPERDVRQGHADRQLRHQPRRAARLALAQGRPGRAGPGLVRGLQPVRARLSRPASTSATACSTSASAAPAASTCATR